MVRVADMRHRVAVQKNTKTDSFGERVDNWATIETVYASVDHPSASDILHAETEEMSRTVTFGMRYRTDLGTADTRLLPQYRLQWDGRTFDIKSIVPDKGTKRFLKAIAIEKVLNTA